MRRVVDQKRRSLEVKVPKALTRAAVAELQGGKGRRFQSVEALFDDLGI